MSTQFHPLKVSKIFQETPDTVSVSFSVPEELKTAFEYKQGQYLTLRFNIKGQDVRRAYSLSSSPNESNLTVTVKRVENGLVSNYINDHLKEGAEVQVMEPQGRFFSELNAEAAKSYYLFGAGSGITPLISIAKAVVEMEPKSVVYLLYGSRNEDCIIFKDQLDQLGSKYQGQLFITHTLSKPLREKTKGLGGLFSKGKITWQGKTGRIDPPKVRKFIEEYPNRHQEAEYFICGPNNMINNVEGTLMNEGVHKDFIHSERFSSTQLPHDPVQAKKAAQENVDGVKTKVLLDGNNIELVVPAGKTVLDALLDLKYEPPYSCTSGSCSTCMAKVVKGSVNMEMCFALDDDEVADGYILTCQSFPTSDELEVTYDV